MKFKRLAQLALLMTCSEGALADWKKLVTTYNAVGYADLSTLRRNGELATLEVLIDYERPPFDGNNLRYLSLRMTTEYHCRTKQFRALTLASFTGRMGSGSRPYVSHEPDRWQPVLPRHLQEPFWKAACAQ